MKYYVKVNNEAHEVELVERSGRIELSYDGKAVDARYEEVDRLGQVSLFLGETCYAVSLEGNSENVLVTVAGRRWPDSSTTRSSSNSFRSGFRSNLSVDGHVTEWVQAACQEVCDADPSCSTTYLSSTSIALQNIDTLQANAITQLDRCA